MKRIALLALAAFLSTVDLCNAAAWVQMVAGGAVEARAISSGTACPSAVLDGKSAAMTVRAAADAKFPLVCALAIPSGAKSLTIDTQVLALPVTDPQRILVLGDTGCRIKGTALQA